MGAGGALLGSYRGGEWAFFGSILALCRLGDELLIIEIMGISTVNPFGRGSVSPHGGADAGAASLHWGFTIAKSKLAGSLHYEYYGVKTAGSAARR